MPRKKRVLLLADPGPMICLIDSLLTMALGMEVRYVTLADCLEVEDADTDCLATSLENQGLEMSWMHPDCLVGLYDLAFMGRKEQAYGRAYNLTRQLFRNVPFLVCLPDFEVSILPPDVPDSLNVEDVTLVEARHLVEKIKEVVPK